ncbi:MAG: transcription antitermination factor NusB [Planctomycetes bacterium]|nr:transcription antitermination factor NusB [Planctomycetota bacterium]
MPNRHDIRRLTMQILYQFDLRGDSDHELIHESLGDGPDPAAAKEEAFALAGEAWTHHADADSLVAELAPQWPTHRQPPVDRAILRLAYHEIITGRTPYKVAINEAVELAKEFGAEQSPSFVNGVLDKLARRVKADTIALSEPAKPANADGWLDDAMKADDEPTTKGE